MVFSLFFSFFSPPFIVAVGQTGEGGGVRAGTYFWKMRFFWAGEGVLEKGREEGRERRRIEWKRGRGRRRIIVGGLCGGEGGGERKLEL